MLPQNEFNKVLQNSPGDWKRLMDEFEKYKKRVEIRCQSDSVTITPPTNELIKLFKMSKNHQDIKIDEKGRLLLPVSFIIDKMREVAKKIASYIENSILSEIENDVDAVLLVGGFANSRIVIEEMRRVFGDDKVIVPENSELCVVKGAVLFGWNQYIIRSRKSRYSYGFCVNVPFNDAPGDEFKHLASFTDKMRERRCDYVFDKLVAKDQDIANGEEIKYTGYHAQKDAKSTLIALYRSLLDDPKFCNFNGVNKVAEVKIDKTSDNTRVNMCLYFGDTEIHMKVVDEATGKKYEKTFNFLTNRTMNFA